VRNRFPGKQWQALQQSLITDTDSNGFPEAAILLANHNDGRISVVIMDTGASMTALRYLGFDTRYARKKAGGTWPRLKINAK